MIFVATEFGKTKGGVPVVQVDLVAPMVLSAIESAFDVCAGNAIESPLVM